MGIETKSQEMKFSTCVVALALCAVVFVQADELKDLSSVDVNAPVESASLDKTDSSVTEAPKSDIGEGAGNNVFAGALLTSGSFTMMASTGFEEEEEELGEGEGNDVFAGALLTSGSFTMMASTGF